ncbi:MAG: YihY/virulence factor BrkB family protein [Bacteroidales bacterium]|nr:YihY/virulence factor BrkB family protein [Bacteroidales bacterium]
MSSYRIKRLTAKAINLWRYCSTDVWRDTRRSRWIDVVKTLNLSVRSFLNHDIQSQACSMTYRTLLAIVPALALLFAIGRGFGLQNALQDELYRIFPAQHQAVSYAMQFVDSYLSQASEGLFVGVGIVFLLWTMISLLSNVEDVFNTIWSVKQGRSFVRKITDYTAMLMILPVIMICAGGLSLMLSSTIRSIFDVDFLTPLVSFIVEGMSWVMTWLFFGLLYILIPNTRVKTVNALIAGVFAGTGFLVLQWVFVTGQMYVARYNAIYGSFSFLPLMLIWMQLTWVVTLAGGVICYSSQNIFMYNFDNAIRNMSSSYYSRLMLAVCALSVQDFVAGRGAMLVSDAVKRYNLPPRLVSLMCDKLVKARVLSVVEVDPRHEIFGYQPALDPAKLTVAEVFRRLDSIGSKDFIPDFKINFPGVAEACRRIYAEQESLTSTMLLSQLEINRSPKSESLT